MSAIAQFPGAVDGILEEYNRIVAEGGRLSDVLSGYIDPDDGTLPAEEVEPVGLKDDAEAKDKDKDEEDEESDGDSEEEEGDGGRIRKKPLVVSAPFPSSWKRPRRP